MSDPYDTPQDDTTSAYPSVVMTQPQVQDTDRAERYLQQHSTSASKAQASFEDIMKQRSDAVAQARQMLDQTIAEMKMRHEGAGPGQINLPLLALGAGMLDPSGPGGFGAGLGTQLSRGLTNMGSVISQQRMRDSDFLKEVAGLQQRQAQLSDIPLKDAAALAKSQELAERNAAAGIQKALITSKADRPYTLGPGIIFDPRTNKAMDAYTQQEINLNPSVPGANGQPSQPLIGSNLHGEDFLKALNNPTLAQTIKGYGNYNLAVPSMPRSPQALGYMQNLMAMVQQYNQDFDQHNYAAIQKGMAAWQGQGQYAQQQRSATALGEHLGNFQSSAAGLNNNDFSLINKFGNMTAAATGSPNIARFLADKQAALTELAAFLGRGHPAEGQMHQWEKTVDQANSPQALQAAMDEFASVMHGQAVALARQKTSDMRKPFAPDDIYGPETTNRLRSILQYDISTPGGAAGALRRRENDRLTMLGQQPKINPTQQQWDAGITMLKKNPNPQMQAAFDDKFGEGAAKMVLSR